MNKLTDTAKRAAGRLAEYQRSKRPAAKLPGNNKRERRMQNERSNAYRKRN